MGIYDRVTAKIRALADNPDHGKPLRRGLKGKRSLRVGDRRIIYSQDDAGAVAILTVKHRRGAYE